MSSRRKNRSASKAELLPIESIFGPPPILPGEDMPAYEALLGRVSADVKPADTIEKIWVRDVVDQTWEIFRLRKIKVGLASQRMAEALSKFLDGYEHEFPQYSESTNRDLDRRILADRWVMKDPDVVAWVSELEANGYFTINEVMASAFAREADGIERVDRLITVAEGRRNSVLREIERRRATFARSLRGEIEKVEDAEFEIVQTAPRALPETIKDKNNAA